MGENQGVIWVLIGALVLGVAIFAMGKYFSTQTDAQGVSIAFQQQTGVDEAACENQDPTTTGKEWKYSTVQLSTTDGWDVNDSSTWTGTYPTGDCAEVTI